MMENAPLVLLPACTFPRGNRSPERAAELQANLFHIHHHMPDSRILLVDSGDVMPELPDFVESLHCPELFSSNPSLGEATLLLRGLDSLGDNQRILKLHARCPVVNFSQLQRFMALNNEFLLLSRNIFSWNGKGINRFPYVDTRVFCLRTVIMRRLLVLAMQHMQNAEINFEQSMVPALFTMPAVTNITVTRGPFFPILRGRSGHGRDYSSISSLVRSNVKAILYRFGF